MLRKGSRVHQLLLVAGAASLSTAISALLAVVRNKIVAEAIGPEGLGAIAQAFNLYALTATIIGLGLSLGTAKFAAEFRGRGDPAGAAALVLASLAVVEALAVLAAGGTWLLSEPLAFLLFGDGEFGYLVAVTALGIPLGVAGNLLLGILVAYQAISRYTAIQVTHSILAVLATAILTGPWGLAGATWALVLAYSFNGVAAACLLWPCLRRDLARTGWEPVLAHLRGREPMPLLPAIGLGVAGVIVSLLMLGSDLLVRAALIGTLGLEANGFFQAVYGLSMNFQVLIVTGLHAYTYPRFSRLRAGDPELASELSDAFRLGMLVGVPCLVLLVIGSPWLVPLLFSHEFEPAVALFPLEVVADWVKTAALILGSVLLPTGRVRALILANCAALGILQVIFRALLPTLGIPAAQLGLLVGYAVYLVGVAYHLREVGDLRALSTQWLPAAGGLAIVAAAAILASAQVLPTALVLPALAAWVGLQVRGRRGW